MYDVAIIGAGPAGATLARLIGNKLKVLLVDKRRPAESKELSYQKSKCCGGLLAPDAQQMIAKLGLGLPGDVIVGRSCLRLEQLTCKTHWKDTISGFIST